MYANISILEDSNCKNYVESFVTDKMICAGFYEVSLISK